MQSADIGPAHVKHPMKHGLHTPSLSGYSLEFAQGVKHAPFLSLIAGILIFTPMHDKQSFAVSPSHV